MGDQAMIQVSVCAAFPDRVEERSVALALGSTVRDALQASGLLASLGIDDIEHGKFGVFGKQKPLDALLHEGDRVEIYRPLIADPKASRRERAAKIAAGRKLK